MSLYKSVTYVSGLDRLNTEALNDGATESLVELIRGGKPSASDHF